MDYTVNVEYNENCEYKGSKVSKNLPIINESQEVDISVTIDAVQPIVISEPCPLTVTCTHNNIPIRVGYVTINNTKTKCYLNNEGQAVIKYNPLTVGENIITIQYFNDEGLFEPTSITHIVTTKDIPTHTSIVGHVNAIASLEEEVTIKAQVTLSDGSPLTYGRVTFLHYISYPTDLTQDRIEKIIGNPVYLDENGEASITYIPMQDYQDDADIQQYIDSNEKFYVEYIRAVYNYNKNSSGEDAKTNVQWQYYSESDAMSYIYIKQPNTVTIEGFYEDGTKINYKDYRPYIEAKNNIILRAYVNTNEYTFAEDDIVHIIAHGSVRARDTYTETDNRYVATHKENNVFETAPINLSPGFYDFYAETDDMYVEKDGAYEYLEAIEESMHYYLQVDYNQNTSAKIFADEYIYVINKGDEIDVEIIMVVAPNQFNALLGQQCHLVISPDWCISQPLEEKYDGMIHARFSVTFDTVKDYSMYAYTDSIIVDDEYIPSLYTKNIQVLVQGNSDLNIELIEYLNQYYPGSIKYKASLTNIKGIVEGEIYNCIDNTNELIERPMFDAIDSEFTYYIPDLMDDIVTYLKPGEYTLTINADNKTESCTYTIYKSQLKHTNSASLTSSNSPTYGAPQQKASIILSSNGGDLTNMEIDKAHIYIKPHNDDNAEYQECEKVNYALTDNNHMVVTFQLGIYTADTWDITFTYDEDDYFTYLGGNTTQFESVLLTPSYDVTKDANDDITITINNNAQLEYIPLLITMLKDERGNTEELFNFIGITDTDGMVTLKTPTDPEDKIAWNVCNKISITTNPANNELIDIIKDNEEFSKATIMNNEFDDVFCGTTYIEIINEEENATDYRMYMSLDMDVNVAVCENEDNKTTYYCPPVQLSMQASTKLTEVENNGAIINLEETNENETLSNAQRIYEGLRNQLINYESKHLFTYFDTVTITQYIQD